MNTMNQSIPAPLAEPTLDQLCAVLAVEKARLAKCQQNVREAEEAIVAVVGAKDEGSFSIDCDGYKVTTTQPVRRVVDTELAKDLQGELPPDIYASLFDWKPSLSVRVYKDLEKYQPDWFAKISRAVTSKPGKVSVKVEDLS